MGLANQGETVVAWDAVTKRPLHNAIVWQDDRTRPEIERLRAAGVEALTLARAGLPLDAYFSAASCAGCWIMRRARLFAPCGAVAAGHQRRLLHR